MSTNRDFDWIAAGWLAEGPSELNDRVLDAALDEVHLTHQRRRPVVPWRTPYMSTPVRLAAALAIVAIVGFAGFTFIRSGSNFGGPSPTPSCTSSALPSTAPSPGASPLDRGTWVTYVSTRFGFSICYPADWIVRSFGLPSDPVFPGVDPTLESFTAPDKSIFVSAWSVAVAPGTNLESWIQAYCVTHESPCSGLEARTTAVTMDGYAGDLVAFNEDVEAFVLIDNRIYAVASWRPATMFNSLQILQAFVSTTHLLSGGPVPVATTIPPS